MQHPWDSPKTAFFLPLVLEEEFPFPGISASGRAPSPTKRKDRSEEKSKDRSKDKAATKESGEKDRGRDKTRKRRSASSGSSSTRSKPPKRDEKERKRRSPSPRPTKVHVGRLTRNVTKDHIMEIFSTYGKIKMIDMPVDRLNPHLSKGYAYVEFENPDDAEKALKHMDGGPGLLGAGPLFAGDPDPGLLDEGAIAAVPAQTPQDKAKGLDRQLFTF
ncbi:RNA-binding protein with serine-rich domain 1 [Turdus rufiventris]|nr:RNA-binding protein with serine-rich domain 1 [Turdus rufiventris]